MFGFQDNPIGKKCKIFQNGIRFFSNNR